MADNFSVGIIFKAYDQATTAINRVSSSVKNLSDKVKTIGDGFRNAGLYMTGLVTAPLTAIAYKAYQQAEGWDTLRNSLNIFTKDAVKTKTLLEDLDRIKATLPIDEDSIDRAALSLAKFKTSSEKIPLAIKVLGEISAGSGLALENLAETFGRFAQAGVQQSRLLIELSRNGIPIMDLLMKETGKDAEQIKKLGNEGLITQKMITKAFKSMTQEGGLFFDSLNAKSKSFLGIRTLLNNSLAQLNETLGLAVINIFKLDKVIPSVVNDINKLSESINEFSKINPIMAQMIVYSTAAAAALGPLLLALGTIVKILPIIKIGFAAILSPLLLWPAAISGVAILVYKIYSNWQKVEWAIKNAGAAYRQLRKDFGGEWLEKFLFKTDKIKMKDGTIKNLNIPLVPETDFKKMLKQPKTSKSYSIIKALSKESYVLKRPEENKMVKENQSIDINVMLGLPSGMTMKSQKIVNASPGVNLNIMSESLLGNAWDIPRNNYVGI